ncbi:MAG: histone deacetylase [Desulfomonilia bacterium]|nr:histone deacetylase [Desulfomonilia bacterium]
MIGIVSDPLFMKHDTGGYHPEDPLRIHYLHTLFAPDSLRDQGIMLVEPVMALKRDIELNHDSGYVEMVARASGMNRLVDLDPDTICSPDSYEVALYAAGSLIQLTEMALDGTISAGFACVRPPGHHAIRSDAMGFCLFNNIAIAARKARSSFGISRVIIVDFDVHHGNGTQESFYSSKDVLYFSSHQWPFYPGTGRLTEMGSGPGTGFTVNCPLRGGKTDGQFVALYQDILVPVMETFKPELVLVSAGFDAHGMDPIGGMQLSSRGFAALAGIIHEAARKIQAPVVYSLEGGYNYDALKDSVQHVVAVMRGEPAPKIDPVTWPEVEEIRHAHSRHWPL